MKILKWIGIGIVALAIVLFLAIESFYLYSINQLDPKFEKVEFRAPQVAHDALWVSSREKGSVALEKTSATGFLFDIARVLLSEKHRGPMQIQISSGFNIAGQVSRGMYWQQTQSARVNGGHLDNLAITIWLTRNAEVEDLMDYILVKSFYGQQNYGLAAASQYYFNRDINDLDSGEVVSLISLLVSPSRFNPCRNPDRFTKRVEAAFEMIKQNWPVKYGSAELHVPDVAKLNLACFSNKSANEAEVK